jgi:hypothetical protein
MLHAAVQIALPPDEFEAAAAMTKVAPVWTAFVSALTDAGFKFDRELKTSETKATGPKRVRRGRQSRPVEPVNEDAIGAFEDAVA